MNSIAYVAKKTLENLEKRNIEPTPNVYREEFYKVAKLNNCEFSECLEFDNIVLTEKLGTLSNILQYAMTPSLDSTANESLNKFKLKINTSPELVLEENIQKEMQIFLKQRFFSDNKIAQQKTTDMSNLLSLTGSYLSDVINNSVANSDNISVIDDELKIIFDDKKLSPEFLTLQGKLIKTTTSMKNEINKVYNNFTNAKHYVDELEKKVLLLEDKLTQVKVESDNDYLTGLLTRKAFEQYAIIFDDSHIRNGVRYAIVFFDLDNFKKINDTYGHKGGDVVLSTFAKVLSRETRKMDVLGRYGGEEFVALISYEEEDEIVSYLKRIKQIVTTNNFLYNNKKIRLTFSAGVTFRTNYLSYDKALEYSDVLLYRAKELGRNQIRFENGLVL